MQQDNSIQIEQDGVVQGAAEKGHVELHCVGPSDFWRGAQFDGTEQSNTEYKGTEHGMVQGVFNTCNADSGNVVQSGARLAMMLAPLPLPIPTNMLDAEQALHAFDIASSVGPKLS